MDLSDPTRAVTGSLDGSVLAVLAAAGRPLTVGQIVQKAERGSEIGLRRSVARLVEQGLVRSTLMGRNHVHELNRDHVAAPVADLLAGLRTTLWERLRAELTSWRPNPIYASVFGSAARGDGDTGSDIDLLLVHQPFPGERTPSPRTLGTHVSDALGRALLSAADPEAARLWERHLERLHERVEAWTGNPLQIVDLSFDEWRHPDASQRGLLAEIQRDGVELVKARGLRWWPTQEVGDG
jgi:predicted nucleotidyltransferase